MKLVFREPILSKDNLKSLSTTGRRPHYYLPKEYKSWETRIGWLAREQLSSFKTDRQLPLKGLLIGKLDFYFKDKRVRDVQNYQKSFLDALNGIVYRDDSQFFTLILDKYLGCTEERIELELVEITEPLVFNLKDFLNIFKPSP